jgi:hypothetical protein
MRNAVTAPSARELLPAPFTSRMARCAGKLTAEKSVDEQASDSGSGTPHNVSDAYGRHLCASDYWGFDRFDFECCMSGTRNRVRKLVVDFPRYGRGALTIAAFSYSVGQAAVVCRCDRKTYLTWRAGRSGSSPKRASTYVQEVDPWSGSRAEAAHTDRAHETFEMMSKVQSYETPYCSPGC